MILFLLIFVLLYGGMHAYFFVKFKAAFSLSAGPVWGLALFLLLMVLAPILVHQLERLNCEWGARLLAYFGYTWMGFIFLFFAAGLLVDLYRMMIGAGSFFTGDILKSWQPGPWLRFLLPAGAALGVTLYGLVEASQVRLETIKIKSSKIPVEIGKLTIAQISDVHLGLVVREHRLKKILNRVMAAQPDILVSTGDLVDGEICRMEEVMTLLRDFKAPRGKFAITGNHEYYAGLKRALECTEQAGFKILRGEMVYVANAINIAGVDDPQGKSFGQYIEIDEMELLSKADSSRFTLFLKHRPEINPKALGLFDLQLSGHTHKGQIWPFTLLVRRFFPRDAGSFPLGNGSWLHVSRGSGTWGPPIRFLAPPEVTVIEIARE